MKAVEKLNLDEIYELCKNYVVGYKMAEFSGMIFNSFEKELFRKCDKVVSDYEKEKKVDEWK